MTENLSGKTGVLTTDRTVGIIDNEIGLYFERGRIAQIISFRSDRKRLTGILFDIRLTNDRTLRRLAKTHGAELTVMEEGEHWFHTEGQVRFLDNWIMKGRNIR